jgi:hypothetical protein
MKSILCISDLHAPFMHPDTVRFLAAVKAKYRPDKVVLLGDEVDSHALSYHESDPDLPSAGDELQLAIDQLKPLYKMFPQATVLESNHGSMAARKMRTAGIPKKFLREPGEVIEAPKGWKWVDELILKLPSGETVLFHHGLTKEIMKAVAQRGCCVVQGHFHTDFKIGYLGNPFNLLWGLQVGCAINGKTLAFAYNKLNLARPVVGHGIILDGTPRLLPMILNSKGRWTGRVP